MEQACVWAFSTTRRRINDEIFWENTFEDLRDFISVKWAERQALIFQDYQTMAKLLAAAFGDGKANKTKVIESADQLASLFKTQVRPPP